MYAHGMSESDIQAMMEGGSLRYIWLGATHMLTGYDHLLFLFGVIFFLTSFRDIVKFITIFTIGHSITLIFATFMGISANYYLIDAVIAMSVIYKGFDNNKGFENYFGTKSPNLLLMVFMFGLIHGFGLSTRLQLLPLGEQNWEMLWKIISLNIGVEIGQIIALVLIGTVPEKAQAAKKLRLGMIASSPSKMIKRFSPLMKYLKSQGIPTGRIVVAKTTKKMIKLFKTGKVDFMFESAYSVIQIMDATKAVPILIREKKGVRVYNSVIFVKKSSSIKRLRDLKGKVITFEDPTSTSSYLLPRGILENAGLTLEQSRRPIVGKVAYYFSKDDVNTIAQVKAGRRAKAGGIKRTALKGKSGFRMLKPQSVYVPRHIVLVRKGVSYKKLKKVLLSMKRDSKAKKVPITGTAKDLNYNTVYSYTLD